MPNNETIEQGLRRVWKRIQGEIFNARAECELPEDMPGKDVREVVADHVHDDKMREAWSLLTREEQDKYLADAFPFEVYC